MVFVDCGAHAGTLDVVGAAIVSAIVYCTAPLSVVGMAIVSLRSSAR